MDSNGYAEIDHTADLALKVWGDDFASLLIHAARGMYALMGIRCDWESPVTISFTVENSVKESILVDFLNELLYFCEDHRKIFDVFRFEFKEECISVNGSGWKMIEVNRDIKAVTFHDLIINEFETGFVTVITFDV